jgi:predicted DNA-binding ribbon-helix-helix protein
MRRHKHRKIIIHGHPTSLRLEPVFWQLLREVAFEHGVSLIKLIEAVSTTKSPKDTLASALRVLVALHYRRLVS